MFYLKVEICWTKNVIVCVMKREVTYQVTQTDGLRVDSD